MNLACSISILCVSAGLPLTITPPMHGAEPEPPVKLALHPRAEPKPALKYRLLPNRLDQISGNAAVHYGKVTAEEWVFFGRQEMRDKVDQWQEMPLEKLLQEKVILPTGSIYFLEQGARCKYCDWQLPIGEVPFYTIFLPEAQQSRSFGRLLAAKARLEIANGKFDDAVKTFQTNYALARNVAKGETIVNGLVGIAISGIMFPQVLEFVQQPDAPNLYWALTKLPTPLIEFHDALDVERMGVELSFPELRDIKTVKHTPNEWRELFHRLAAEIIKQISTGKSPTPPSPEQLDELCKQKFPEARQALILGGLQAEEVDAMATYQIALLYSLQTYRELLDDAIKFVDLPYPQAIAGINAVSERARQEQREIIPIAERILPAIQASKNASTRNDRGLAVLRLIEALRIYGANHDGKLPERLEDITEVPIPVDPVTGLPFEYHRDGEIARLQAPVFRDVPLDYEITMIGRN